MINNKLIAEFMGYKISDRGEYLLSDSLPQFLGSDHREWCSNRVENDNLIWEIPKDCLEYHTSWDWLMPVVEKIESFQDGNDGDSMRGHLYNFRIEQHFVYILDGESMDVIIEMNGDNKLDATYNAVVEFIKNYNK